jgi:ribosomal protein L5
MFDIKENYQTQVRESLKKQFGYKNDLQVPRIVKVVINMGLGEATSNAKAIEKWRQRIGHYCWSEASDESRQEIHRYF